MIRNTLLALVAGLGLTTWGATQSFAQGRPGVALRPQALVVTQVFPGGSAARQGIEVGDVIVSVNGNPVRSAADLQLRLGQAGPVAELGLIDVRTGWQNQVLVYPTYGRIGVDVRPTSAGNTPPVRPVRPMYPPWTPGGRPGVLPVNPGEVGTYPLPQPGARPLR
jgi:membrane-associated protease RseP (regulator of RpoE activity)